MTRQLQTQVPVFFYHLHKCAGTYVRKSFEASGYRIPTFLGYLENNEKSSEYPIVRHKNGNLFYASRTGSFPDIRWSNMPPERQQYYVDYFLNKCGCNYMSSEWDFPSPDSIRTVSPSIFIFTAIRSPLARALSNWRFDNQNPRLKGKIETFELWKSTMETQTLDNFYVRSLAGVSKHEIVSEEHYHKAKQVLKSLDSVIVLERHDLFSVLNSAGIAAGEERENVSKEKKLYELSDRQAEQFAGLNHFDTCLYEYCCDNAKGLLPRLVSRPGYLRSKIIKILQR